MYKENYLISKYTRLDKNYLKMASNHQDRESDNELDELLDDALLDFEKQKKVETKWANDFIKDQDNYDTDEGDKKTPPNSYVDASAFKRAMEMRKGTLGDAKSKLERFEKCGQNRSPMLSTPPNSFVDHSAFQKAMEAKMKGLEQVGGDDLEYVAKVLEQGDQDSGQNLEDIFGKLNLDPSGAAPDFQNLLGQLNLNPSDNPFLDPSSLSGNTPESATSFLPMMETMMQSLLSKELLYPAVKDLADKFPDWLADNRDKLPSDEFDRYNKQFDLAQKICHEFEKTVEDDVGKKKQFEVVMDLMQSMQSCGNPPGDLVESKNGAEDMNLDQCKVS